MRTRDSFLSSEIHPSFRINFVEASVAVTASSSDYYKIFSWMVTPVVNPGPNKGPDFFILSFFF